MYIVHDTAFNVGGASIKEMNRRNSMMRRLEIAEWRFEYVPNDPDGKPYHVRTGWDMNNTWKGFYGKYKHGYNALKAAQRKQDALVSAVESGEDWATSGKVFQRYERYIQACQGKSWVDFKIQAEKEGTDFKVDFID